MGCTFSYFFNTVENYSPVFIINLCYLEIEGEKYVMLSNMFLDTVVKNNIKYKILENKNIGIKYADSFILFKNKN